MKLLQKKGVAVAVCCLLVVLAILFGSHRSLSAVRHEALQVYAAGDETGLSILANLNSITEYAGTLLRTAGAYYSAQEGALGDIQAACDRLRGAKSTDIETHRQALADLQSACTLLQADYAARADIPEEDLRLMNRSINDILSMKDQMRHSAYNEMAADFNSELGLFPAWLLAGLTGVKPLPLF